MLLYKRHFCDAFFVFTTYMTRFLLKYWSLPVISINASTTAQYKIIYAWSLCFKIRVKSKIRSCNFSQFSQKQIFGKYYFLKTKAKRKLQSRGTLQRYPTTTAEEDETNGRKLQKQI
ncbi:Hypothetical_protein [Hexamita inflata]|uniref:Hypothetical_protein n=1 Tax=Hexamita inflata TaxID=28002 RepID=A0AA86PQ77_9EUKA|nr:Hypothetical protein HINF_LOCUS29048 [Hexamita inflata]